jgi:hypothetical protein
MKALEYRFFVSFSLCIVLATVGGFQPRTTILPFHRGVLLPWSSRQTTGTCILHAQSSETLRDRALNGTDQDEYAPKLLCAIDFSDISSPFVSRMDSESTFVDYDDDGTVIPAGRLGRLKEEVANFLREPVIEIVVALAVLINSLLVALSTLDSLAPYMDEIRLAINFVSLLFCVDFAGRWFSSSRDRGRHILDAQFALDVLVVIFPLVVGLAPPTILAEILPPWLINPSGLFNLELLRVLRLRRVLQDLDTFEKFMERALGVLGTRTVNSIQEWQLQLCRVLLSLFTLVSVSTGLIYTAEHTVNPAINNYFDALYFGLTTLTTVGFGGKFDFRNTRVTLPTCKKCKRLTPFLCLALDVTPVTWQGKFVVCGSILVGVAVVPAQAASLVEALLARDEENKRGGKIDPRRQPNRTHGDIASNDDALTLDTTTMCSSCGATFHWTKSRYCHSCGQPL